VAERDRIRQIGAAEAFGGVAVEAEHTEMSRSTCRPDRAGFDSGQADRIRRQADQIVATLRSGHHWWDAWPTSLGPGVTRSTAKAARTSARRTAVTAKGNATGERSGR